MTEIKPALSKEEWAAQGMGLEEIGLFQAFIDTHNADGLVVQGTWIEPGQRHKLAALCLYAQPFGFTREDVNDLRSLANVVACGAKGDGITDDTPAFQKAQRVASLADRIEALLPEE